MNPPFAVIPNGEPFLTICTDTPPAQNTIRLGLGEGLVSKTPVPSTRRLQLGNGMMSGWGREVGHSPAQEGLSNGGVNTPEKEQLSLKPVVGRGTGSSSSGNELNPMGSLEVNVVCGPGASDAKDEVNVEVKSMAKPQQKPRKPVSEPEEKFQVDSNVIKSEVKGVTRGVVSTESTAAVEGKPLEEVTRAMTLVEAKKLKAAEKDVVKTQESSDAVSTPENLAITTATQTPKKLTSTRKVPVEKKKQGFNVAVEVADAAVQGEGVATQSHYKTGKEYNLPDGEHSNVVGPAMTTPTVSPSRIRSQSPLARHSRSSQLTPPNSGSQNPRSQPQRSHDQSNGRYHASRSCSAYGAPDRGKGSRSPRRAIPRDSRDRLPCNGRDKAPRDSRDRSGRVGGRDRRSSERWTSRPSDDHSDRDRHLDRRWDRSRSKEWNRSRERERDRSRDLDWGSRRMRRSPIPHCSERGTSHSRGNIPRRSWGGRGKSCSRSRSCSRNRNRNRNQNQNRNRNRNRSRSRNDFMFPRESEEHNTVKKRGRSSNHADPGTVERRGRSCSRSGSASTSSAKKRKRTVCQAPVKHDNKRVASGRSMSRSMPQADNAEAESLREQPQRMLQRNQTNREAPGKPHKDLQQ
ncbi:unnamed protein product [Choristocarpus tenellus]